MFRELSIEQTTIQHPRDEILVIFWGQDKVMFPRAERVLALNGWWEQATQNGNWLEVTADSNLSSATQTISETAGESPEGVAHPPGPGRHTDRLVGCPLTAE